MENNPKNAKTQTRIAILAMMFLFGMIAFVTNLAAPVGIIWKNQPALQGSNALGMMGNMMNFLAYLFMGIPCGHLLNRIGYKKTLLTAIAIGLLGVFVQYLSGQLLTDSQILSLPANFFIYLAGAFIAGISVCMLNTAVNPMLNLLGGGGNRGNQLILWGGTLNSLLGTLTPMLVGLLIGTVTAQTAISDVNPILYIAMAVFALTFLILARIPLEEPQAPATTQPQDLTASGAQAITPWLFLHFRLGAIAIFCYVGTEVGIPGTLNFFLSDTTAAGAGLDPARAAAIGGFAAGTYWLLMLVGRVIGGLIANKISSRTMIACANALGILLILLAILLPQSLQTSVPIFTGSGFALTVIPACALPLILCGLCTSVMWSCIFNLATEGLGKYTQMASGIFMTMVVGGGFMPVLQNILADNVGYMISFVIPACSMFYMLFYGCFGSKNVNRDIPVE